MYKIQENCSIPNSCNLSCKMNDCISIGFLKSAIVQLLWKCCIKGANDQVEVQTTCSIVYLMGYWNTTILKLFRWLENQWEMGFTILVIDKFFPVNIIILYMKSCRKPCINCPIVVLHYQFLVARLLQSAVIILYLHLCQQRRNITLLWKVIYSSGSMYTSSSNSAI